MPDEYAFFGRILGTLSVFLFLLLAAWVLLVYLGKAQDAVWMTDLMKAIAGAFLGIIGGFGIAKRRH